LIILVASNKLDRGLYSLTTPIPLRTHHTHNSFERRLPGQ
jgi:hypothetical protein